MRVHVVMLDRYRTEYGRRHVEIELTPEQLEKLKPMEVGTRNGKPVFEEIGEVWIERARGGED